MAAETGTQKMADTANAAEEKAIQTIDNVESTKFGKKIPTNVHEVKLKDIIKIVLMSSTLNFIPCYLIYGREYGNKLDWLRAGLFLCFIIFSVTLFMFALVAYASNTSAFFKFCLFSSIGKASFSLILMIMANIRQGWIQFVLSLIFYLYLDVTDFLVLYYLAIFFKRIESDEYDDNGEPLKNEEKSK